MEILPASAVGALYCGAKAAIERAEERLLHEQQVDCPLTHSFAPGVYLREVFMPAGIIVIGHEHVTEHFNIVLSGRAKVMLDGVLHDIVAPCSFVSKPGVRKVLYIEEDMRWATVHPTQETNIPKLEKMLVVKSPSFEKHFEDMKRLKSVVSNELPAKA